MILKWVLGGYKERGLEDVIGACGCALVLMSGPRGLSWGRGMDMDHSFVKLEGDEGIVVSQECPYSQELPGVWG